MSEQIDERPGPAIYPADFGKGTKKELDPVEELDPPVPASEKEEEELDPVEELDPPVLHKTTVPHAS